MPLPLEYIEALGFIDAAGHVLDDLALVSPQQCYNFPRDPSFPKFFLELYGAVLGDLRHP